MKYILPIIILSILIFAFIKRVNIYSQFVGGVKRAIPLILSILPYLSAIIIMSELLSASGLSDIIISTLSPVFTFLGVPKELTPLVLIKPFSGSGALTILKDIYANYGVDSYISKVASVIYSSSESIFYIGGVYYSKCKNKPPLLPFIISLISNICSVIFACLICRFC